MRVCPDCNGTGYDWVEQEDHEEWLEIETCPVCRGAGVVDQTSYEFYARAYFEASGEELEQCETS